MTRTHKGLELLAQLQKSIDVPHSVHPRAWEICSKICRLQASIHAMNEARCNRELSDLEEKRDDQRMAMVEKHAKDLSACLGVAIGVLHNGDPRGPSVKLTLPAEMKGAYNCFGGEGVCVP